MEQFEDDVYVTLWNEVEQFGEDGSQTSFTSETNSENFTLFATLLRTYWEQPFRTAQERLEDEATISVATPKPKELAFDQECEDCGDDIPNEEIHFEIIGEEEFQIICRDCFLWAALSKGDER